MMEIKKTEFGELRVWAPYNRDFDKKIKAVGGQMLEMPGNQCWTVPGEVKISTIRKYMYESYGRSDLDDERDELLSRLAEIEDYIKIIKGGNIMEKQDVFGNPVITDRKEMEDKIFNLFGQFDELFASGWRDDAARIHEKETFLGMLEGCAEGVPEDDVWGAWGSFIEAKTDKMERMYGKEKAAAIMSGDDKALAEIAAREHEKEYEDFMKDIEKDLDLG